MMEADKLRNWQNVIDLTEGAKLEPELLPVSPAEDAPIGSHVREGQYLWVRVLIKYGKGRWAYWLQNRESTVCADDLFNGDAPHFAGLLVKPHTGGESTDWLMVEPRLRPVLPRPLYIEDIERKEGRYETNDVDRIK